jgi:hypothetical protein
MQHSLSVYLGIDFASQLSDGMLVSALAHEAEHVRLFDPLRYLVLQLSLAVNPMARPWLSPHLSRWYAAREAHCDRRAVLSGAEPLSLAQAIVRAARPVNGVLVGLGTQDTAVVKLRVGLLLAFAERLPVSCNGEGRSAAPLAFALMFIALLLPHVAGTVPLDALHTGTEHTLHYLLGSMLGPALL